MKVPKPSFENEKVGKIVNIISIPIMIAGGAGLVYLAFTVLWKFFFVVLIALVLIAMLLRG